MLTDSEGAHSPNMVHSVTALMPWARPWMIMARIRRKMFDVSEIMKYARVRMAKAEKMGPLKPNLSASFPDGMQESMYVIPRIPNKSAIRDGNRRRLFSACTAKKVMKKANVKEKEKRR